MKPSSWRAGDVGRRDLSEAFVSRNPVVSRNTITTECADIQSLVEPVLGLISDRAYALGGPPNGRDRVDSGVSGSLDQSAGGRARGLKSDTLSNLT